MDSPRQPSHSDRLDQAIADYYASLEGDEPLDLDALAARYPDLAGPLADFLADKAAFERQAGGQGPPAAAPFAPTTAHQITLAPAAPAGDQPLGVVRYFGDYELLEEIARGGMGVVFKARQVKLDRIVALKMILAGQLAGDDDVKRFHQEARTAANLQHPGIVAIHEVGEHDGQHYFSMDFIDGDSLASLVRDHPLQESKAVRYVLLTARAVQFAHEHGVLHRDLKPSNVLVDRNDVPHVTDFGLAKQTQADTRLTASGAVLGTPSYMPPEQADARRGPVGPASDVYSLGALLYELVTGRPPFRAATTLDTILQVLNDEPAPPRLLNPAVSRDLETVILKCLAKEPSKRYASAADLADDLQALLDGEPIRARRPGLGERAARYLRKEKRSVSVAARAVLLSLLLLGFGWLTTSLLLQEGKGSLLLDTRGMPLRAEVLAADRDEVRARFRVPHETAISLPAGAYRVRLAAPGQLGQTFRLLLDASTTSSPPLQVALDDRQRDALPVQPGDRWALIDLAGRADLVVARGNRLSRLDAISGKPAWEVEFAAPAQAPQAGPPLRLVLATTHHYRAELLRPAPDLDGDGVGDLVWLGHLNLGAVPNRQTLWAISGKTGKELWHHHAQGRVLGLPFSAPGKGPPTLVATLEQRGPKHQSPPTRWIEAFAGPTGWSRWRYPLDGRWFGAVSEAAQAWPVTTGAGPGIVALDGTRLVELAVGDGRVLARHELGFRPAQPPFLADLDGDGQPEAVLLRQGQAGTLTLLAFSLRLGKPLWAYPLEMKHAVAPLVADLGDGKAAVLIVNGETDEPQSDRAHAVGTPLSAMPAGGGLADPAPQQGHWLARHVDVLDGSTGQLRWRYEGDLLAGDGPAGRQQVAVGPDVRGEGSRTVLVLAQRNLRKNRGPGRIQLEPRVLALSGKDGRALWQRALPRRNESDSTVSLGGQRWLEMGLHGWWSAGPHDWPLLLVLTPERVGDRGGESLWLLSGGSGEVEHTLPGVREFHQADLDGDGLPELCYWYCDDRNRSSLRVLRGGPPVVWRHLGSPIPAGDFDGDGLADLVDVTNNRLAVLSGRDARLLWQQPTQGRAFWAVADLGPGHPDVLAADSASLRLFSGSDGKQRWQVRDLPGVRGQRFSAAVQMQCHDLDGSGEKSVVLAFKTNGPTGDVFWLAVVAADGTVRWRREVPGTLDSQRQCLAVADLDGDGTADVLLMLDQQDPRTGDRTVLLRALSGSDGSVLWEHLTGASRYRSARNLYLLVADLDGDGRPEVVLGLPDIAEVRILDGRTGKARATAGKVPLASRLDWAEGPGSLIVTAPEAGKRYLCAVGALWPGKPGLLPQTLLVTRIDAQGRAATIARRPIGRSGMLPALAHGDGLVIVWPGHVEALRSDGTSLWRWRIPGNAEEARLETILADVVVARLGASLHGLDGRTGRPTWRCEVSGTPHLLPGDDSHDWPRIVCDVGDSSAKQCLLPLPTDENGKYRPGPLARPAAGAVEDVGPTGRPLPWAGERLDRGLMLWLVPFLLLLVFCLLRGDVANLLRLVLAAGVATAVLAQVLLAGDGAAPAESYDLSGWYLILPRGTAVLGVLLLPVVLLRALLGLAGWRSAWLAWLLVPLLGFLLLATVTLYATDSSGARTSAAYLLGAQGTAVAGGLLLLASLWLGRRPPTSPARQPLSSGGVSA